MDGAESGGLLLFVDGFLGSAALDCDVGWDAELDDFGGGGIGTVMGGYIAPGLDEAGAVSRGAMTGVR
jgi:hypothetical protein